MMHTRNGPEESADSPDAAKSLIKFNHVSSVLVCRSNLRGIICATALPKRALKRNEISCQYDQTVTSDQRAQTS